MINFQQRPLDSHTTVLLIVKPLSSRSAPAGMDAGIAKLMKKDVKPYLPKTKHQRLSYEYPGLPNEDDFTKHTDKIKKQKPISRWSLTMPKLAVFGAAMWGAYVVKVWFYDADDDAQSTELLDPDVFHKFVVTHKQQIDKDHFLVEVRPKYNNWQYSYYAHYASKTIWNGDRMWSVEVKQPDILVVRSYTPLPLYFMKSENTHAGRKEPLLRVVDNDCEDHDKGGVMTFYIKRYADGEVSRYIVDKDVGDELELRGPHVEYKFPHHPLNALHERPVFRDLPSKVAAETLVDSLKAEHGVPDYDTLDFYAAGTGIAPILQVLFSRNPYRGFVNVHYSARADTELAPLQRFLFFLEKLDRIKLIGHYDSVPRLRLTAADIKPHRERNYISDMRQESGAAVAAGSEKERLRKRVALLEGAPAASPDHAPRPEGRGPWYENALQQARATALRPKPAAALALVCGPDGFVDYVAGAKELASGEQGPVGGLLGAKGWDESNVYKL
ncbi:hypothetical protein METBIDRAFT_77860 [Metschnikowia bicuspidata var. bicuspidata NRRL YB-4993]|uniref:FAD-binding FR-type domain-containing protein n=1 Tax=Metschnikowia bicuspidata var. bicuspidata NRRL YB-4993 TaxID=869754 RepID=A0A1A0HEP8_9ASCO|nr:hypothetical protein METBIDRAFT_77860 [Metschnikowia bicuspidata var. bicuspidata NRRL YB-4993]OBA22476.1 hypothetical protein METBIDRAFT_77860 [Metschnikowia bicuspidata var. bicuspidata NRRL YB-4993]